MIPASQESEKLVSHLSYRLPLRLPLFFVGLILLCALMETSGQVQGLTDAEILALGPPPQPHDFEDSDQMKGYLKSLNDYFAIAGRPR